MNKKIICIDARFFGISHTGIGRYVENLIVNLPKSDEYKIVLIVDKKNLNNPIIKDFERYPANFHPYTVASFFEMHLLLLRINPDLLHVPHLTVPFFWPGKIVITIHDLIKHYSRGVDSSTKNFVIYWIKYLQYLIMSFISIVRSNHIIVPSKYWKDILIDKFPINKDKITVTYEGVGEIFLNTKNISNSHNNYLVYTGNIYPHKNVSTLIKASESLQIPLKIICSRSVFESRLPKSKYVEFLGNLTDEDVIKQYQSALAFVFPSLYEGFGLPGLEAMSVGLPVISSNSTCLPEIYGDAALYFDPLNCDQLKEKITQLQNDPKLRRDLILKGKRKVSEYSWVKMSEQTWEIYIKKLQ